MNFRETVLWHARRYPRMTAQDLVKLAYQSACGSGHMLPSREEALRRLEEEIAATPQTGGELFTPIGGGLCRMNLAAFAQRGLRAATVAGLFLCAAGSGNLDENLSVIRDMAREGVLPVSRGDLEAYLDDYCARGCPPVSHSDIYRSLYAPAYRLAPVSLASRIRLLQAMDRIIAEKGTVRVAVDGMSASGKTTLGEQLRIVYGANLFHMDDFFLPLERKTPERLAESGGNVDYERFYEEVARHENGEEFEYRPYECGTWRLLDPVRVTPNPVFITEGAYSLHPTLRSGYDLKVFFGIDPQTQSARIMKRNGPEKHKRFIGEWIPMENRYIADCGVKEICDVFLSSSDEAEFLEKFR